MITPDISQLLWAGSAGLAAGFVLGLLGAGGTVVGLPLFLYIAYVSPHTSLGSNALGVSVIAAALYLYRLRSGDALVAPGVVYALPGLVGIYIGAGIGLQYPGSGLVFILGFVLLAIAGWLAYLSRIAGRSRAEGDPRPALTLRRALRIIPVALLVGGAAGFFGIGGGFMIVPSLSIASGIELTQSISSALLPIAAFAGMVGSTYLAAGDVNLWLSASMVPAGLLGGYLGIRAGRKMRRTTMYLIFAGFLALLGAYIIAGG